MSRKMLINASEPEEIRVAIVEGSILEEYYVERMSVESVVGNIFKGRVTNVEPSIGAAFVDFGGPRHGFLHITDVMDPPILDLARGPRDPLERGVRGQVGPARAQPEEGGDALGPRASATDSGSAQPVEGDLPAGAGPPGDVGLDDCSLEPAGPGGAAAAPEPRVEEEAAEESPSPPASRASATVVSRGTVATEKRRKGRQIQDCLKKGQEVAAQVTKDGIGTKGPTLTTYLSLPGRYLVLMPGLERRGVSRKIEDGKERERLKKVLAQLDVRDELGFIVRTAGVGQNARALQKDYRYLTRLWDRVEKQAFAGKMGELLYRESDLVIRTIRDIYGPDMGDIIIDDEDVARRARDFLAMVMPKAVNRVKFYNGERPLFHAFGIEEEIGRLFMHRVELLSGGSLVIEQTEALVAIDVNSGRFREEGDLEETAYKINLEAAAAIARQLRLRDLGGVIVVDFIDMRSEKRRRAVERAFRAALKSDRARIKVARMSPFGVIELTRQRVRPSLRQSIFQRCPACRGAGYVATQETLELNLVRQLKLYLVRRNQGVEVFLNQANLEYLVNRKRRTLALLEKQSGKPITVKLEPELPDDEFRIIPLDAKGNP